MNFVLQQCLRRNSRVTTVHGSQNKLNIVLNVLKCYIGSNYIVIGPIKSLFDFNKHLDISMYQKFTLTNIQTLT